LTEELVRQGHDVTLFASGDSTTRARLVSPCPTSLRLGGAVVPEAYHTLMLEQVFSRAAEFDVIHFHVDVLHYPLARRHAVPSVTTLHGRLDLPDLVPLFREFSEMPLVSISDAQRAPIPWANWQGTVHHGLPPDLLSLQEHPGDHLVFLGRIAPEKGVDRAIEIARRVGKKLRIAAKIDRADRRYFETHVASLLEDPLVEYVGEIGEHEKSRFLGEASALLFPVDWPEPFGLVIIEALACGTPVVAFRRGSVPEIVEDGVTGFVVDDVEQAALAVERVGALSRRGCRAVFEERFTVARMARDYLAIYDRLSAEREGDRIRGLVGSTPIG
jgi:glycosyltransferase involved in cell wall biosynthesis